MAAGDDGRFVVVWESYGQDGDRDLLRFEFGFTGPALINAEVGPACTRCEAGAIAAYLSGRAEERLERRAPCGTDQP